VADAPLTAEAYVDRARRGRPAIGYALVLGAVGLWSLNATMAKVIVDSGGLTPLRLAELRATGAGLILFAAVALVRPQSLRIERRELGFFLLFGIAGLAFVHFLYFTAITHLDIGIALVIQYIAPVLVAVWARFFVHEPVRRRLWLALALALTGLSLVVEIWNRGTLDGVGVAASLAAACAFALYIILAERSLQRGRDVYSLLAWGFLFAAGFWAIAPTLVELSRGHPREERLAPRTPRRCPCPGLAPARLRHRLRNDRAVHPHDHVAPLHPGDAGDGDGDDRAGSRRPRRLRLAWRGDRRGTSGRNIRSQRHFLGANGTNWTELTNLIPRNKGIRTSLTSYRDSLG
jgi:drug/metabolite transporter (DMT)-like permease